MNQIVEWAKSRRSFLTAAIALMFVLLREKLGLPIDEETSQTITNSLVLWIIGESAGATKGWMQLVQSPRFWALTAAIANAVLKDRLNLPITPDTIQQVLTLVQTLLAGYAIRPHISPNTP